VWRGGSTQRVNRFVLLSTNSMRCVASRSRVNPKGVNRFVLLSTNSMRCVASRVNPKRVNRFVIIN